MGDYDAEKVPMADAYEKLKEYGVKAILYTTARNTPSTPGWRVVAPYAEPIIVDPADPEAAAKKHIEYMNMLNGVVGGVLAGESWNRSLAFYYGYVDTKQDDYEFFVVDGQEIDTIEGLPSQGKPVSKTTVKRTADPAADDGTRLPRKLDYIAADWRERIETGNAAEYGNDRSRLVAAVARYLIEMGLQAADVYALLTDERFGVSAHCIENEPERAATRAIEIAHEPPVDVADLNKHYAFTVLRGKSAILREGTDSEGRPTYDLLQTATFMDMLRNRVVQVGKKRITLGKLWIDSPHRRL